MMDYGIGENPIDTGPQYGLSHAALKARPAWVRDQAEFEAFFDGKSLGLPESFKQELCREWSKRRAKDAQESARWGFSTLRGIRSAEKLGVRPADSDAELCRKAESEARQMSAYLDAVEARVLKLKGKVPRVSFDLDAYGELLTIRTMRSPEWLQRLTLRAQAWAVRLDLRRRGVDERMPQGKHISPRGIVSRAKDPIWWRRILRRMHAKMLEGTAIALGLVHAGRRRGCYVSEDSLKRRRGQRLRNAAVLAGTVAVNERGEADSLANIAAKGVANGEVRRAELMTRISGFEVIANDLGHHAVMVTVTCPSRMHKWRRGAVVDTPNPSYDGTLPDEAQAYIAKQWGRFRSAADRAGLELYGFRISEPHHDGCPHWHMLLWHKGLTSPKRKKPAHAGMALGMLLMRYFLANDNPDEPGAAQYRIKVEAIDPSRGSAVAYVAKYVAKNIDGYKVGNDLYGNPALESSARVEAWASTWRIRQFQQIGGAPVGVWRELRRVHPGAVPMDGAQALHDTLMMVNVASVERIMGGQDSEASEAQRIRKGWAAYVMAQGGPTAGRKGQVLRVLREQHGEANRYGELGAPRVAGVVASSWERATVGIVTYTRPRRDEVESERSAWVTSKFEPEDRGSMPRVVQRLMATLEEKQRQIDARRSARGEALRPWTRVNNCTALPIGHSVVRTPKRGQVFRWPDRIGSGGPPQG